MRSREAVRCWILRIFTSTALVALAGSAQEALAQTETEARAARITVGGRLNTQFALTSVEGTPARFFHRRARLKADVEVGDFLDGRVEADFAGGGADLLDGWARVTFGSGLQLSVGQFKRAFSGFELASSSDMPIIERDGEVPDQGCPGVGDACVYSRLTQGLGFDGRDIGARAEGELGGRFGYSATFTNGQGTNAGEVNDAKSFSGRVVLAVTDGVRFGAFGGLHDFATPLEASRTAAAWGLDLEVGTWRNNFHLLATIVAGENWKIGPEANFIATHLIASYHAVVGRRMLDGIEPVLRIGWADPDRGTQDVSGLLLTPGVMVWMAGKNGLSVNLDAYDPAGEREWAWSLKAQAYLFF